MIRVYRVKDIFNVHKTLTRHLRDFWGITKPSWTDSQSYWFVAFNCKKAGYLKYLSKWVAYGGLRDHNIADKSVYFGPSFVKEEWRGQGLQVQLINKRLEFVKEKGYLEAISSTYDDNYASCNSLIKCGFKLYKGWFEEPETNSLYWFKKL